MREIQFSGPAKYVYASEAEAEIRKAYERGRKAGMADKKVEGNNKDTYFFDKIADLESQIESLQKVIDLKADTIELLEYEVNKKWDDHVKLVEGLKDAVVAANKKIEKLEALTTALELDEHEKDYLARLIKENKEWQDKCLKLEGDYQKMITEVLKLNPLPACKYGDQLEPPWEVIKRARLHLEKLEAVRRAAQKVVCFKHTEELSDANKELQQALREAK